MSCEACTRPDARRVTLVDGRQVCSYCEAWRHECEARHILAMPSLRQRRATLYGEFSKTFDRGKWAERCTYQGIRQKRGEAEVQRLEATMRALWRQSRQGGQRPANDNEPGHTVATVDKVAQS